MLPSPPTTSPTDVGGLDVYYPDYDQPAWPLGFCINTRPLPSGRPTYTTMLLCCKGAYGGQSSGICLSMLPSPPTTSPTDVGELDVYYADYDQPAWPLGFCINTRPLPSGRPTYTTMLLCCKGAYGGQQSGVCLSQLPSPPTVSPTDAGEFDFWYPDYSSVWAEATCLNTRPLPFGPGGRPTYDTMLDCCKREYRSQASGACVAALPSPPTSSPTNLAETGGLDVYYPNYDQAAWPEGICISTRPLPSGRPSYSTKPACCQAHYGGQLSETCMCDAVNVCYSCTCGSQAERDAANCTLTCS